MDVKFGQKDNWKQLTLLVVINAFPFGTTTLKTTKYPKLVE